MEQGVENKRPGFFQLVIGSFHQWEMYERFRTVRTGAAVGFLALFVFFLVLIGTVYVTYQVNKGMEMVASSYEQYLPEIRIVNGEVEVDAEMPLIISPENGEAVVIIDNTGSITNLDEYDKGILLTKDKLYTKKDGSGTRIFDLAQVENFTLNREVINNWRSRIIPVFFPSILILWFFFKLAVSGIQVLIFALAGKGISDSAKLELPFRDLANLSMLAYVPASIAAMILFITGLGTKLGFVSSLLFLGLYLLFLHLGIQGVAKAHSSFIPVSHSLEDEQGAKPISTNTSSHNEPEHDDSREDSSSGE